MACARKHGVPMVVFFIVFIIIPSLGNPVNCLAVVVIVIDKTYRTTRK